MRAKILIQSAWLKKLDWDTPLPSADALAWTNLLSDLPHLNEIRVSRWLGSDGPHAQIELHRFADASERGYAAVVYLRSITGDHTAPLAGCQGQGRSCEASIIAATRVVRGHSIDEPHSSHAHSSRSVHSTSLPVV